ncbi:SCO family protein [Sinomicrobium weinanense]|uniref:SCO family protein n=1 Tax=Sinomicrobium weinanense TaxID=2842200 RepID=A0A926Q0I5_9FLAO|nr:SCO family protein [Sinomicrobium weinanense]MBC9794843.1 SCO family protein [Sinomicrobium weinanense]MBU3125614.1 SCO family protein [Sinomicrobium weinanense]
MKKGNYTYIWVSLVILVFGIIFIPKIIDRVKEGNIVDSDRHKIGQESKKSKAEDLVTVGEVPPFKFTDQYNNTITNEDYKGKVYVVEFFFTTCPTICPVMNENMIKIQNAFQDNSGFGIASFTINPENDTPEVLKAYAEKYGVKHPNWHFLTGDQDAIYNLANNGFNLYAGVNPEVEGGFEHSGMFALIDGEGNIRSRTDKFGNPMVYYDGLEEEGIAMLKEDIAALLGN